MIEPQSRQLTAAPSLSLKLTDMCNVVRCIECRSWLQKGAALQCLRVRPRSADDDYEGRLCDRCWAGD